MFIQNNFDTRSSNYAKFAINLSNIDTIWKKDDKTLVSVSDFAGIARQLVERIETLESNVERLSRLVGKIADKLAERTGR